MRCPLSISTWPLDPLDTSQFQWNVYWIHWTPEISNTHLICPMDPIDMENVRWTIAEVLEMYVYIKPNISSRWRCRLVQVSENSPTCAGSYYHRLSCVKSKPVSEMKNVRFFVCEPLKNWACCRKEIFTVRSNVLNEYEQEFVSRKKLKDKKFEPFLKQRAPPCYELNRCAEPICRQKITFDT